MSFTETEVDEIASRPDYDLRVLGIRPPARPPGRMPGMGIQVPDTPAVTTEAVSAYRKMVATAAKTAETPEPDAEILKGAGRTTKDWQTDVRTRRNREGWAKALRSAPPPGAEDPGPEPNGGKLGKDIKTVADLYQALNEWPKTRADWEAKKAAAATARTRGDYDRGQARRQLLDTASLELRRRTADLRRQAEIMQRRIDHHAPALTERESISALQAKLERLGRGELLPTERPQPYIAPSDVIRRFIAGLRRGAEERETKLRELHAAKLYEETKKQLHQLRSRAGVYQNASAETAAAEAELTRLYEQLRENEYKMLKPENMAWAT